MNSTSTQRFEQLDRRLHEAFDELWASFVDPREAWQDQEGSWLPLGGNADERSAPGPAFTTEVEHRELRRQCRALAVGNEFAINALQNRINYIVGCGHRYVVAPHKNAAQAPAPELLATTQDFVDEFLDLNRWSLRQPEIVLRNDRDGESFLRLFPRADGQTLVRFVEPVQVTTPGEFAGNPADSFGIRTEPDDIETVRGYFIDGQLIDPRYVQHRRTNVDLNVKRGLPLLFPVRQNLRRVDKLLRNMTVVAEIQSAIALIRHHRHGNRAAVQQFISQSADVTVQTPASVQPTYARRYAPGTILDAHADVEYEFPVAGVNAGNFVTVLQAELRAIAARLVMPEFMFTSDASNANYASTMVAESPAVRMFERAQQQQMAEDRELLWRVVELGVEAGRLPSAVLTDLNLQITAPTVQVRNAEQETQVNRALAEAGVMSRTTWASRAGLDYAQERELLAHEPPPTKNPPVA